MPAVYMSACVYWLDLGRPEMHTVHATLAVTLSTHLRPDNKTQTDEVIEDNHQASIMVHLKVL